MKFLCMSCDEQMKLLQTIPPDEGSGISVVYGCPNCSSRIGMLTNPWETQVVTSLGVKIGGQTVSQIEASQASEDGLSKCPFSEMVREMGAADQPRPDGPVWTEDAFQRLQNIPEFVRPMAKQGIEKLAADQGYSTIDEKVLDQAKEFFGM